MPNGEGIKVTIQLELVGKEALAKVKTEMKDLEEGVAKVGGTFQKTVQPAKVMGETVKRGAAEMRHGFSAVMGDLESLGNRFRYLSLVTAATSGAMVLAMRNFVQTSMSSQEATLGLAVTARAWGRDINEANRLVQDLTSTGLMNFQQASMAVMNLMAKGLDIPTTEKALKALLDRAVFYRELQYDIGEAVVATTEGIKENKEQLADATLIQGLQNRGIEEALRLYGGTRKSLSDVQKAQGMVNVILKESIPYAGGAAAAQNLLSGTLGKMNAALWRTKEAIGTALQPAIGILSEIVSGFAEKITNLTKRWPDLTGMIFMTVTALTVLMGTFATIGAMLPMIITGIKGFKSILGLASMATGKFTLLAMGAVAVLGLLTYGILKLTGKWDKFVGTIEKVAGIIKPSGESLKDFQKAATEAADETTKTFEYVSANFEKIARDFSVNVATMARDQAKAALDAGFAYDRLKAKFKEAMEDIRKKSDERYTEEKIKHARTVEDITQKLNEEISKGRWADQTQIRDLEKRLARENEDWARFEKEHAERLDEETKKTEESFVSQLLTIEKSLSKSGEAVEDLKGKLGEIGGIAQQQAEATSSAFAKLKDPAFWAGIRETIVGALRSAFQVLSDPEWWSKLGTNIKNALTAAFIGIGEILAAMIEGLLGPAIDSVIRWFKSQINGMVEAVNRFVIGPLQKIPWIGKRIQELQPPFPEIYFQRRGGWQAPWPGEAGYPFARAQFGAIVRRPSLIMAGESGPEAIVPLNRMPSITININNPIVREAQDIRRLAETIGDILSQRQRWAKLGAY